MTEAAPPEPPASRARAPFIMPDGRPLAAFLDSQELRPSGGGTRGGQRRRPGAIKQPKDGWSKPLPRAATAAAAAAGGDPCTEAERAEMYALSRVGQRKQRRWLNDKLLRDMAGMLSAADMASLFKPVPFGEQRTSLWERAAQPEHAVLWDLFRSLDMDKQGRVLQKWEAHVRELQAGPAAISNPAVDALAAWAGVSSKARQAMKRAGPSLVQGIEAQLLAFLGDAGCGDELVVEGLQDSFQRLIAHGLAEYHDLASLSRPLQGGGKEVVVRRHRGQAAGEGAASPASGPAPPAPLAAARLGAPEIACSDILHLLLDGPQQPLSAASLRQAYLQPLDTASEPGDVPCADTQQQAQSPARADAQEQQAAGPLHTGDDAFSAPSPLSSPLHGEQRPLADSSQAAATDSNFWT